MSLSKVPRSNIKYNPRKDKWLRTPADDALEKEHLKVTEPTLIECGGIVVDQQSGTGFREVEGLEWARVKHLTDHMKPLKAKQQQMGYRSPAEVLYIRQIQAGRMQFELNRLKLLRERRMPLLMRHANADGKFGATHTKAILNLLYGPEAPPAEPLMAKVAGDEAAATPLTPEQLILLITAADVELAALKQQKELDNTIAKHDSDSNGGLSQEEVLPLLKELSPDYSPDMDDVQYLFSTCDKDGSGAIEREELQSLLDTWKEMVKSACSDCRFGHPKPPKESKKGSSACSVL